MSYSLSHVFCELDSISYRGRQPGISYSLYEKSFTEVRCKSQAHLENPYSHAVAGTDDPLLLEVVDLA